MSTIDGGGYVCRTVRTKKAPTSKGVARNWWFIKYNTRNQCIVDLHRVHFPKRYAGKKVRFKAEIICDEM